jgi:putative addiction module killer protein
MLEILKSATYDAWLAGLKDRKGRAKIQARIDRLAAGNPGDVKPTGSGVSEMRVDFGPGYRVYYIQPDRSRALLLCGGDKRTQDADIKAAVRMAAQWRK